MPERESMRPSKRNALLTFTCVITICALAAAVAGCTLAGRASPARQSLTCCTTARPTAQHRPSDIWLSWGVHERQWAGATSGAARQISVPFLRLLDGGVVGSLPNAYSPIPAIPDHIARNWWEEGGGVVWPGNSSPVPRHRHHLARHRRPPAHQRENPPRTLPRKHSKTGKRGARTRPGALAEGN